MSQLVSDRAQVETRKSVLESIRAFYIHNWNSETYQQHQNPAEQRYQTVKHMTNTPLDRSGPPAYTWLIAITYVRFIINHTYCNAINTVTIHQLTRSTGDI